MWRRVDIVLTDVSEEPARAGEHLRSFFFFLLDEGAVPGRRPVDEKHLAVSQLYVSSRPLYQEIRV
jgi:hypothetical protein